MSEGGREGGREGCCRGTGGGEDWEGERGTLAHPQDPHPHTTEAQRGLSIPLTHGLQLIPNTPSFPAILGICQSANESSSAYHDVCCCRCLLLLLLCCPGNMRR